MVEKRGIKSLLADVSVRFQGGPVVLHVIDTFLYLVAEEVLRLDELEARSLDLLDEGNVSDHLIFVRLSGCDVVSTYCIDNVVIVIGPPASSE